MNDWNSIQSEQGFVSELKKKYNKIIKNRYKKLNINFLLILTLSFGFISRFQLSYIKKNTKINKKAEER